MNLVKLQELLNRLYTEDDLRDSFFKDKEKFYRTHLIDEPGMIAFFAKLDPDQLAFFSKGLYSKRLHAINHALPGVTSLLKEEHPKLFKAFSRTFSPEGIHKHQVDALHYCYYLSKSVKQTPVFKSVLKFETDLLRHFLKPSFFSVTFYAYNPIRIRNASTNTELMSASLKRSFTLIAWQKGMIGKIITPFK